jgi:hypothetical protein
MLTFILAKISSPPMGANMMPMRKKSGSTVFGVRMGLSQGVSYGPTLLNGALHVLPCFQSLLPKRRICTWSVLPVCAHHCPAVPLTRWSPALRLLVILAGWILAREGICVLDLLYLRHCAWFRANPRVWW